MLSVNFFLSGTVEAASTILTASQTDADCGLRCELPAATALAFATAYLLVVFSVLWHFHTHHASRMWQPLVPPPTTAGVDDAVFRAVSKVRVKCCPAGRAHTIIDRARGEFAIDADDLHEPECTERLLATPLDLFRRVGGDAFAGLKLTWLKKARGGSFVGTSYHLVVFAVQIVLAFLAGLGPNLEFGSTASTAQVVSILSVQYATSAYLYLLGPSNDRIDNGVAAMQFLLEGSVTLSLLLSTYLTAHALLLQDIAFYLSLAALFTPLVEKVYDALIDQVVRCVQGRCDPKAAFFAFVALAIALPATIAQFLGFESVDSAAGILDEVNDAGDATVQEALVAADVFSGLAWLQNPLPEYHQAAMAIQASVRGKAARKTLESSEDAQLAEFVRRQSLQRSQGRAIGEARIRHIAACALEASVRQSDVEGGTEDGSEEDEGELSPTTSHSSRSSTALSGRRSASGGLTRRARSAASPALSPRSATSRPGWHWLRATEEVSTCEESGVGTLSPTAAGVTWPTQGARCEVGGVEYASNYSALPALPPGWPPGVDPPVALTSEVDLVHRAVAAAAEERRDMAFRI